VPDRWRLYRWWGHDGDSRNFDEPDEVVELAGATEELITMGGLTLSRSTQSVGWRWSEHFEDLVGGELCQARHMGYALSGILGVKLEDGTVCEIGPGELYDIPPGHDGYTVGDEPFVSIEWSGMRTWVGRSVGSRVGEVELAGEDVRGVTVHEAARIMAAAGADQVFASEAVRVLCRGGDLTFEDAGEHELKGVPGTWQLFRAETT